ncbi:MAG TPA: phosphoribosylformylglycinamidine synthase subunit PurS [Longimicrobiaceae bacterium]|nr:phosphoribosylformylglycinamidine synthase subunit PurS [Longimicrobiaceae bacterium]
MDYQVEIRVVPRRGILDPQGQAVHGALATLGFSGVGEVHVGRLIRLDLTAESGQAAEDQATAMCRQLLANPVTEDFEVEVHEAEEAGRR